MTDEEKKAIEILCELWHNADAGYSEYLAYGGSSDNREEEYILALDIAMEAIRKAEEVRKETAKEIIEKLIGKRLVDYDPETNEEWATWLIEKQDLQFLIDEYGVEIDDNK